MDFEWDENKNSINKQKHGISFEEAKLAFDETMIVKEDTRIDYGETRYIGIGKVSEKIIVIVYTLRKTVIRLISARLANKKEKQIYYEKQN